jgi:Mg2+ and Co2+ transporter CorA
LKKTKAKEVHQVFNLVTQQDSVTNTDIARETKADSSSMKTIAALTMIFLPGTFTSSVFSMNIVDGAPWWAYVAVTLPLTVVTITAWWFWTTFSIGIQVEKFWARVGASRTARKGSTGNNFEMV